MPAPTERAAVIGAVGMGGRTGRGRAMPAPTERAAVIRGGGDAGGAFQDIASSSALILAVAQEKGVTSNSINGKWILEHAQQGDTVCSDSIERMTDALGMGIANLCYVLNPEVVVVGGGIMAQKDYLYPRIRQGMERYLLPAVAEHTRLAFAQHRNHAGLFGAYYHFCARHPAGI